jgi:trimeric autotransporter adhesin
MGSRKWMMVALLACGLATACQDYNTNLSVQTSSSTLIYVSPGTATVGSQGFLITANGTGFTTGAEIQWNGVPLVTNLVSSAQLTATVPASDLATTGAVQISIRIPGSAQSPTQNIYSTTTSEVSNIVLFTVTAVQGTPPSITSLSPNSAPYCGNATDFPLTVTGTGFTSDSMVNWNGSPRPTNMVSSTQLTATIFARDTVGPSPAAVTVSNSSGTSNSLQFTISSNTPTLPPPTLAFYAGNPNATVPIPQSPNPTTAPAGSDGLALEIDARLSPATSFSACSVVQWAAGGTTTSLPTLYTSTPNSMTGSPTSLTTTIPASLLSKAGTANIQIFTPGPGGGTSAPVTFTITPAQTPSISSITAPGTTTSVTSTPGCNPASLTLQVNGTNFVPTSVVNWNGQTRATTYVQPPPPSGGTAAPPAYLTVVIPYTDTLAAGTATITVSNGSLISNSVNFTVTAPSPLAAPTVTSITPSSAMAGSPGFGFVLIVTGTNFFPCSKVQFGSSQPSTTYLNPTQLSIPVSATDLTPTGTLPVTVPVAVSTPPPGGGLSSPAASFTILPLKIGVASVFGSSPPATSTPYCSPSGFTLDVTAASGTTFTGDTVVNWNGSPRPTTFVSATELTAAITYADIALPGSVSITVSNSFLPATSAAATFTLSPPTSLPVPSISSLLPPNAAVSVPNGPGFPLSVIGTGMLPCSTVQWNAPPGGSPTAKRPTTFDSPNSLTAAITAQDISMPGTDQVTVFTPPPGGGTSNVVPFVVHLPVPGAAQSVAAIEQTSGAGGASGSPPLLALHLMSSDQRYTVHVLASLDGVAEVPGTTQNIFVRDTCAGAPSGCVPSEALVSVGVGGNPADRNSLSPSISADGRYVAFLSSARNLVNDDTNGVTDVFVRDTCLGAAAGCVPSTQRVSVAGDGTQADGPSSSATIDASGRYVTFESSATNLGSIATRGLFLRDTCAGAGAACVPSTEPIN